MTATSHRETFGSRFGTIITMIGVAVGLGNVWRFPYMVGKFGGAAFVLFYVLVAVLIGVPALMAEYALGRHTRRGNGCGASSPSVRCLPPAQANAASYSAATIAPASCWHRRCGPM